MTFQVLFICGAVAGLLSIFAYLPYITDTLKGRTQPQRSSWLIWAVLASAAFFAQVAEGAGNSLWFTGIQASGAVLVFLLSIRLGIGNFLNRADITSLILTAFGLCLWYFTDSAVYTLAISIGIGLLGGLLTLAKAYRDPDSESVLFWLVSCIGAIFAIMSAGKLDFVVLAYPFYLFALYSSIVAVIYLGHMSINTTKSRRQPSVSPTQPVQGPIVFRTLVQTTEEQGLWRGLEKLNDEKVTALVTSLKKRGVGENVLNGALHDVVHS